MNGLFFRESSNMDSLLLVALMHVQRCKLLRISQSSLQ